MQTNKQIKQEFFVHVKQLRNEEGRKLANFYNVREIDNAQFQ